MIYKQLAYIAAIIGAIAFIPEAYTVYTTKKVIDLNYITIILYMIAQLLWGVHALNIKDIALSFSSFFAAIIYIYLLYAKITYTNYFLSANN